MANLWDSESIARRRFLSARESLVNEREFFRLGIINWWPRWYLFLEIPIIGIWNLGFWICLEIRNLDLEIFHLINFYHHEHNGEYQKFRR